jgi:1-acyl-sn-glycerol-3-phosphate acyltransferase
MAEATAPPVPARNEETIEDRVLEVVRALAAELGAGRPRRELSAQSSLEREAGLGSLERVELLLRLEAAFGRALDESALQADTAAELARAVRDAGGQAAVAAPERAPALPAAAALAFAPATVHGALWQRAQSTPDRTHAWVREEDGAETALTYGRLLGDATAVAGGLAERGVGKGDAVALMLPTGADFLRAFQGILIAGSVPVPIYPPVRLDRLEEYAARQSAILADAGARVLVTVDRAAAVARVLQTGAPALRAVVTVADLMAAGASWPALEGAGMDPAFIQYTSGSTGQPKGVLLTHDNLLANIRAITAAMEVRPDDVGASWLPLYHDMGLIGSWLFCLHAGLPIAIQSPLAFLSRPERWLWAIHTRRATLSGAPNFAYELCVRKVPEAALQGLDLSSWRCALNGAEPVSPDTLERFARRFAPYGFRREALMPVYGLAENSVALCFPPVGRGPVVRRVARGPFERDGRAEPAADDDPGALRFVSVGRFVADHEVKIVDDAGAELPDRAVGRLVFRGPSMTPGYFQKPEATAAVMLPGGWMDSGDLAFRADGEVHITGRRKDLIIKAGRNLVPQEIEEVVASVEGIRKGCVAAFGVDRPELGTESLVVVAETRAAEAAERGRIEAAVLDRVAGALGLPPDVVCLVPPGAVPKTSSGKIRRAAARDLYTSGALGRPPRAPARQRLRLLAAAARHAAGAAARQAGRVAYAVYLAAAAVLLVPPYWLAVAVLPGRRLAFGLSRAGARLLLKVAGCRLAVEGAEHLRAGRPLVLASNHAGYTDVPALVAMLPMDFVFVAKEEVRSWPLVGALVRKARHVTVDRWDARRGVADAGKVARALEDGDSVLFFPEGTFTAAAGLRPFRLGAFQAAAQAGAAVVPLALQGTRATLPDGAWLPRPRTIRLWIGAPLTAQGEGWRAVVALRDRVADAIAAHCGEPRLDLVAGGPERP